MGKKGKNRYFRVEYSLYRNFDGEEEFVAQETQVEQYIGPFPKGYWDNFSLRHEFDKHHKQVWIRGRLYRKVYIRHEEITYADWK